MFTKKSEILFIGAGKVAHTLIPLLLEHKYSVKGVVSRNLKSAKSLAKKYKISFYSNSIADIARSFRIFFLTVPDGAIFNIAEKLANLDLLIKDSLFVHTSGSENSSALDPLEGKGAAAASFHIMQTFPSLKKAEVKNSVTAIETASPQAERFLFSLARTLGLKGIKLSKEEKVYYHLAGVYTANFMNANFYSSEKLLARAGLINKGHYELFGPIISATLSNIRKYGIEKSLSGPVERGDFVTIKKHIDALRKLRIEEKKLLLYSYLSQSLLLLEIVKMQKRLTPGHLELKKILEEEIKEI